MKVTMWNGTASLKMTVPLLEQWLYVHVSNLCLIFSFPQDTWEEILIGSVEMKGTVCCAR